MKTITESILGSTNTGKKYLEKEVEIGYIGTVISRNVRNVSLFGLEEDVFEAFYFLSNLCDYNFNKPKDISWPLLCSREDKDKYEDKWFNEFQKKYKL